MSLVPSVLQFIVINTRMILYSYVWLISNMFIQCVMNNCCSDFATVVGFSVISVPFLSKRQDRFSGLSHGQIMEVSAGCTVQTSFTENCYTV